MLNPIGYAVDPTPVRNARPEKAPFRILVADDDDMNRFLFEAMLEEIGIAHDIVTGGGDAIAALAPGHPYSGALVDIRMPFVDGLTVVRAVRAAEAAAMSDPVPLIACSADVMPEQVRQYLSSGFQRHLPKPIKMGMLEAMMLDLGARQAA